jgi:hypothetical protein
MAQTINKFFLGNTYPNKLYVGNNVISRVYYGTDQIWGFPPPSIMQFVEKIDNITTGPTIPSYVDNSHIAFLLEYSSVISTYGQTLPVGWTRVYYGPTGVSNKLAISYKILTESDRNTTISSMSAATNRDQMYIFKKQNRLPITSAITGNIQYSSTNTLPTIVAPVIDEVKSAILIHYYYNSADTQPDLSATPAMDQVLLSSLSQYNGGQYKIYNFGSTPTNTTITSTLGGTIRQIAFWVTIQ